MLALPHAEAALKLDPTCAEAARVYIDVLTSVSRRDRRRRLLPDAPARTLREAARLIGRFPHDSQLCSELCVHACEAGHSFWLGGVSLDGAVAPFGHDRFTPQSEAAPCLEACKRLLERGIEDDVHLPFSEAEWLLVSACGGMRLRNVPAAEQQAWLEAVADRCLRKVKGRGLGTRAMATGWGASTFNSASPISCWTTSKPNARNA